jgi:diguanylate cyclase (GGDEF)-like protein
MEARGFDDLDQAVSNALALLGERLGRECRAVDGPEAAAELGAEWSVDLVCVDGFRLATIAVCGGEPPLTPTDRRLVEQVARLLSTLADAERKAAIAAAEAETDPLTGLANRRGWERRMHVIDEHRFQEHRLDRRHLENPPIDDGRHDQVRDHDHRALLSVVDIEGLKLWNDRHGHAAGDGLLKRAASAIAEACRPGLAARIGGDEFAVWSILPPQGACGDLQRAAVDTDSLLRSALTAAGISAAVGSAVYDGTRSTGEVYLEADRRMVAEKHKKSSV